MEELIVPWSPKSDQIHIFPLSQNRSTFDPLGGVLNEFNITHLVKHFTDNDSFVIDYTLENLQYNDTAQSYSCDVLIEFVIRGYYFVVRLPLALEEESANLYLRTGDTDNQHYYLDNLYATISIVKSTLKTEESPQESETSTSPTACVTYSKLEGKDENSVFTGLVFTKSEDEIESIEVSQGNTLISKHTLQIFNNTEDVVSFTDLIIANSNPMTFENSRPFNIPRSSRIKLKQSSIENLQWKTFN